MKLKTDLMITFYMFASSFDIPEFSKINPQSEMMSCPTLKSIMKYRKQPGITAIQDAYQGSPFYYSVLAKFDVLEQS